MKTECYNCQAEHYAESMQEISAWNLQHHRQSGEIVSDRRLAEVFGDSKTGEYMHYDCKLFLIFDNDDNPLPQQVYAHGYFCP